MAEVSSQMEDLTIVTRRPNWGAIWAGVFTFLAIWSVFGALALSIFAHPANISAAAPVARMNLGLAIWGIILTIIAMFVAGRVTGGMSGIVNSRDGMTHGMIMFGLSVAAGLVLFLIGGNGFIGTRVVAATQGAYVLGVFSYFGWALFVALFLGWLAAMAGASSARKVIPRAVVEHEIRHAA
jgi:hypothetical protein